MLPYPFKVRESRRGARSEVKISDSRSARLFFVLLRNGPRREGPWSNTPGGPPGGFAKREPPHKAARLSQEAHAGHRANRRTLVPTAHRPPTRRQGRQCPRLGNQWPRSGAPCRPGAERREATPPVYIYPPHTGRLRTKLAFRFV